MQNGGSVDLDPYVDDPDGDPLTIVSIPSINAPNLTTAFGGSLTLGESGEYTYNSPPFETSTDYLLFKADDGSTQSSMAFGSLSVDAEARDSWRERMIPPTVFDDAAACSLAVAGSSGSGCPGSIFSLEAAGSFSGSILAIIVFSFWTFF